MTEEIVYDEAAKEAQEAEQYCIDELTEFFDLTQLDSDLQLDDKDVENILTLMKNWEAEIARIKQGSEKRIKRLENQINWFNSKFSIRLAEYAQRSLDAMNAGKKKAVKSFYLDNGISMGFRTTNERLDVNDEGLFLGWVKRNLPTALIKQEPKIDKKAVNEAWASKNVIPDGCVVQPKQEKFYVK